MFKTQMYHITVVHLNASLLILLVVAEDQQAGVRSAGEVPGDVWLSELEGLGFRLLLELLLSDGFVPSVRPSPVHVAGWEINFLGREPETAWALKTQQCHIRLTHMFCTTAA